MVPAPTRAPSATMQRLPIMHSSPMMTGTAFAGSRTPPMPTPPDRCTLAPIWAHEPTVAHVSTIEFSPTWAPMFTYDGIITTPLARCEPQRAEAPGTTRTPAAW